MYSVCMRVHVCACVKADVCTVCACVYMCVHVLKQTCVQCCVYMCMHVLKQTCVYTWNSSLNMMSSVFNGMEWGSVLFS